MHAIPGALLVVSAALATSFASRAQTPEPPAAAVQPLPADGALESRGPQKKIERVRIEDAGTRIDELRWGGETQSITVHPKSGAPEYEVIPFDGARQRQQIQRDNSVGSGTTGQRVWKVFGF